MPPLVASLADFLVCLQDAVHSAPVAQVLAFIQQLGIHLAWGVVLEALTVEHFTHLGPFLEAQGPAGGRTWLTGRLWPPRPVHTAAGHLEAATGRRQPNLLAELVRRCHHALSSSG